jgi:tRNA threonylcarbamoyladenosine biosynthesis protein TsaB
VLVLGIDTSTAVTSVGLVDDGVVRGAAAHADARRHAEVLPGLVRSVLFDAGLIPADLSLVACGVGPGPFTGLRVGVTFARAMAQALGVPAVGVCSLDALAVNEADRVRAAGVDAESITALIRVRRGEHAWATYDSYGRRTAGPLVSRDETLPSVGRRVGDSDEFDVQGTPAGTAVAALARDRLRAGEVIPADVAWPEDAAQGTGAPTADLLAARNDAGQVLLPALPLYLRRPDAVPTDQR